MSNRYQTTTLTFSSVTAGASASLDSAIGPSLFNIIDIEVTQDNGASTFDYKIWGEAAHTNLIYWATKVPGNVGLFDGADTSGSTPAAAKSAFTQPYDDNDGAGQLHHQIINNDVVAHTYTAVIKYEEVVKFDSSGNLSTRGLVTTGSLGSGTANSTTFLRGDQSWQVLTSSPVGSYSAQSTSFNAASNHAYWITGNSVTVTLPGSPADGDYVILADGSAVTAGTTVVGRNGKTIMGLSQDMTIDITDFQVTLIYRSATGDWRLAA